MSYSFYIGRKLSIGRKGRGMSPAVLVAIIAVALSVAIMLAAIAIVTGFQQEIRDKVIGFNSHMTVYCNPIFEDDDNVITLSPTLKEILDNEDYITEYSLETNVPAVLKTDSDFKGVYFKGTETSDEAGLPAISIISGKLPEYNSNDSGALPILVSQITADQLGLKAGDNAEVYFMSDDVKVRPVKIAAIFNTRFEKYDDVYIYGPMSTLTSIVNIKPNQATSLRITTDDFDRVEDYTGMLQYRLNQALAEGMVYKHLKVSNARELGMQWFQWLALLDTNVLVVLIIMTVIACVTLISGMLIIILERVRLIGMLRALGASTGGVSRIFVYLATRIALVGMIIGNALMLVLLFLQWKYRFIPLDPDTYYLDHVPVSLEAWQAIALNVGVLAIIMITLLLPSRFVSRISPSKAVRYE